MLKLPDNWQLAVSAWLTSSVLGIVGIAVSVGNGNRRWWLTAICIVLGVTSAVFFISALAKSLKVLRRSPLGGGNFGHIAVGVHTSRWANSDRDLSDAQAFFESLLPPSESIDLGLLQALHHQNPRTIRLIENESKSEHRIVGLVVLVPLTRKAVQQIASKTFTGLSDAVVARHVCKTWREPAGVYVGGIAGSTSSGRAWALSFTEFLLEQSGVHAIYARPASKDGFRVMKVAGFTPLGPPSQFWQIQRP